jgi:hypothetical protein
MSKVLSPFGTDIAPIKSDGTLLERKDEASQAGYALANGATYYYELARVGMAAPYQSFHVKWDIAAILTITVESSCFSDVNAWSTVAGEWEKEDPTTAYVAHDGNSTVVNATVSVPGGTVGGCLYHVAQTGALRTRLKILVGGTGGVVRVAGCAKE